VRPTSAARQSGSEWVQNGFKFRLTFHKVALSQPEEAAPWLERCNYADHKGAISRKCRLAVSFDVSALQQYCLPMCQLSVRKSKD
jgi:hypothetical protein